MAKLDKGPGRTHGGDTHLDPYNWGRCGGPGLKSRIGPVSGFAIDSFY